MVKESVLLLDMDDVMVNFTATALKIHGRPDLLNLWPPLQWEISGLLGITTKEFWAPIDAAGADWWADLPACSWINQLLTIACGDNFDQWYVVSVPSETQGCVEGKIRWLKKWMGNCFSRYIFTPHKYLLATPERLLFDDSPANVRWFRAYGGSAILFPQPWNNTPETVVKDRDQVFQRLARMPRYGGSKNGQTST